MTAMLATKKKLGLALDVVAISCITLACLPLRPMMPVPWDMDQAMYYGCCQAVFQGLAFGRDFIANHGPLSFLSTVFYHPGTHGLLWAGSCHFLAGLALAYLLNFRRQPPSLKALFILAIVLVSGKREVMMAFFTLLVGNYAVTLASEGGARRVNAPGNVAGLGFLLSVFAAVSLSKLNLAVYCLSAYAVSMAALLWGGLRARNALAISLCFLLALPAWMAAAGQPVGALPDVFRAAAELSAGYGEGNLDAVEKYVPMAAALCVYAVAAILFLALLLGEPKLAPASKAFLLALFAPAAFMAFKHGFTSYCDAFFVRALVMAGLMHALLLTRLSRFRAPLTGIGMAAFGAAIAFFFAIYPHKSPIYPFLPVLRDNLVSLATLSVPGKGDLDAEFRESLARIREAEGTVRVHGTADVYQEPAMGFFAAGNDWAPRPVFLSSMTITPALMGANKAHLLSGRRADNVVFNVKPLFGCLPTMADGASYPALISLYEPYMRDGHGRLYLRRRPAGREREVRRFATEGANAAFHQEIRLPDHGGPVLARMRFAKSVPGRLASFLFRPGRLMVRLGLADGSEREYRLVPAMARTEFVVSPLIEDNDDLERLLVGPGLGWGKRVVSMEVYPESQPWQWREGFGVDLTPIAYETGQRTEGQAGWPLP